MDIRVFGPFQIGLPTGLVRAQATTPSSRGTYLNIYKAASSNKTTCLIFGSIFYQYGVSLTSPRSVTRSDITHSSYVGIYPLPCPEDTGVIPRRHNSPQILYNTTSVQEFDFKSPRSFLFRPIRSRRLKSRTHVPCLPLLSQNPQYPA
jgi:hypothetical protein